MTPAIPALRTAANVRWRSLALGAALVANACGGQVQGSSNPSAAAVTPSLAAAASVAPTLTPTSAASAAPTAPAATPFPTETFQFGDILKVQVNNLAARKAPDRSAALIHRYDTSGASPVDKGEVRVDKGNLVRVAAGPLRVGNIVWYLVWPSPDGKVSYDSDWYNGKPADVSAGPAWVAASLDANIYMTLNRRPDATEIAGAIGVGLSAAGTGPFESTPQPRHDAFFLDWAAAAPEQGSPCTFRMSLVPSDAGVPPKKPVDTSTSGSKASAVNGIGVSAPWLPIPAGSWASFTVKIAGTCNWTFRLARVDHD